MTNRIALILLAFAAAAGCGRGSDETTTTMTNVVVNAESANTVTPKQQPPVGEVVGHVTRLFDGTEAFVGSARATEGMAIRLNEHFYTGAGTKMEVKLDTDGSVIMLDQNTDPGFFTTARCFWIRLTSGTMTVTNKNWMCAETGSAKFGQHSYVLYRASGTTTTVAVFEGEVTTISPPGYTVRTGQILTVQNGETSGPQPMDQATINSLQAWIPRIIL
jgi:hypothetical protein